MKKTKKIKRKIKKYLKALKSILKVILKLLSIYAILRVCLFFALLRFFAPVATKLLIESSALAGKKFTLFVSGGKSVGVIRRFL